MSFASPKPPNVRRPDADDVSTFSVSLIKVSEIRPEPVARADAPPPLVAWPSEDGQRLPCWGCGMPAPPVPSNVSVLAPHRQCGACVRQRRSPCASFCSDLCYQGSWKRHLAWHADPGRPPLYGVVTSSSPARTPPRRAAEH